MPKIIVITDPGDDPILKHLSYWVREIIGHTTPIDDMETHVLSGDDVLPQKLADLINEKDPDLVLINGHGSYEQILGYDRQLLIAHDHNNLNIFKGRIIHSLACSSGKTLGGALINVGSRAFIGYSEPFELCRISDDPLVDGEDEWSSIFLRPAHEAVKSLCDGDSALVAYSKSQAAFRESLLNVLTRGDIDMNDKLQIGASLRNDLTYQVILGDRNATI